MRAGRREDFDDARFDRRLALRVWGYARPYRRQLLFFLATIVTNSLLSIVPPLLFRSIVDDAIPDGDRGFVWTLAALAIGVAVAQTALDMLHRWWSSTIGEGLIFDLRTALYDHVQRMPIAFFTRSQTGALVSRMNNDVIGAQRALTGTLGQVVFNVIALVTTLGAMFALEWRLTLLTLLIAPVFLLPAERVGRRLQAITREGMEVNAGMNAVMTERFNVAGALLVKLFGRRDA